MPDGAETISAHSDTIVERIPVAGDTAACDGGIGPLGHPRVFLTLRNGEAICPYCSRLYYSTGAGGH
jgi:uncharacterized Zn-finger protein